MNIGIIGAGNVGRALATASVRAGHDVTISSTDGVRAKAAARDTGARAVATNAETVRDADVVVLAVPYTELNGIADELGDKLNGKAVVDVSNPLKADMSGLATEGSSPAEQLQTRVPKAGVVKAFNTVFASRQADPVVDGIALDGYVSGDDPQAKARVLDLVRSLGFRPIDSGPLTTSRALEALAFLNITLQVRNGWPWQSGWKLVGPTPDQG